MLRKHFYNPCSHALPSFFHVVYSFGACKAALRFWHSNLPCMTAQPHYHIIFRTCDAVFSLHSAPRPFGLDKKTLIKLCFLSLYDALTNAQEPLDYTLHIVADNLSEEMTAFFERFPVRILHGTFGNDNSIRETLRIALALPSKEHDWVYFCEDDYLHRPEAFTWLTDVIRNRAEIMHFRPRPRWVAAFATRMTTRPLVIHTPDYPDRYLPRWRRFSMLFLGKYCHWRQVDSTTFTFLMQASTVHRYKRLLMRSTTDANDRLLSDNLYARFFWGRRALCIAPIPGISTHLHSDVMTPHVDWSGVREDIMRRYAEYFSG